MADSSDEWEKVSSHVSSSSDAETDDDNWIAIKKKKPNSISDQEEEEYNEEEQNEDDDDQSEICTKLESPGRDVEEELNDDNELLMKEMLDIFHPGLINHDKFSVEYTEQCVFPHLPTRSLLRLRHASVRWSRFISSQFFAHTHALTTRSLAGFFFHHPLSGLPSFASLDHHDMSLSFLPDQTVHVKASNHGLLCCRGKTGTQNYYICNPLTAQWAQLPPTIDHHGPETAAVIVMQEPLTFNFNDDYFLVCAYEIFEGVYGFETFSSESWAWRKSNEIVAAERIVPASGVAVAGAAYWRTTMQRVVAFDPLVDVCREIVCPAATEVTAGGRRWEIGEIGRKLCAVIVGPAESKVRVWEDAGKRWKEVGSIAGGVDVVPLRAQGEREVPVWDGAKTAVTVTDMEMRTVRRSEAANEPGYCADFLPYVSSLVHVKSA